MKYSRLAVSIFSIMTIALLLGFNVSTGRALFDMSEANQFVGKVTAETPYVEAYAHTVGRIGLAINNQGHFGTGFLASDGGLPSCQYPYPSQAEYLFAGSFWIGAVVGRDTLVSVGADGWMFTREMWPDPYPRGAIISRSITNVGDVNAISEQDYISLYTDTVTDPGYVAIDNFDGRPHMPLSIEVTQRSFAWSYSYAEDFVLFDYGIKNIGRKTLKKTYMGIYVDADVKTKGSQEGFDDDICGFKRSIPSEFGCDFIDTINIAWIADNDGKQLAADVCPYSTNSLIAVTATRVVRTPSDSLNYSFNWWISNGDASQDFGPRKAGTLDDPFRDFGGFLGTPEGDRNKYYIMRHEEFDYDQLFTALDHTAEGWLPRPSGSNAVNFADGYDTRYLLSFGPFDIDPGEVLPISFAYVAGDNFHTNCDAFKNIFNAYEPQIYYDYLNFDDLGKNAMWAAWIYDNPGVDSDGDGYRGKYRICIYDSTLTTCYDTISYDPLQIDTSSCYMATQADTVYYEGDRVPDFRGASPPPAPQLWVINDDGDTLRSRVLPSVNEFNQGLLRVRWNGMRSETERDVFSNEVDFEGYRVYLSFAPAAASYSLIASYDIEDFNRYTWNRNRGIWELKDTPFLVDTLKQYYGQGFDPLQYDVDNPFLWNDTAYYFTSQDWNQSDLSDLNGIHKVYPEVTTRPTNLNIDTARIHNPEELTDDGLYFKYYEYEFTLKNLLPSQLHYVSVTAFDYGSPSSGLLSLETPKNKNFVAEYPLNSAKDVEAKGLNVIVYPNPYRVDGKYLDYGFEGRDYVTYPSFTDSLAQQQGFPEDRTRSIHFINLPNKCTIRIFTLDGDMVRQIDHDVPLGAPQASHERWDLITRNTQAIVSGIYYYSVESEAGNQIGKIVIIM
ncbi:MAG: hypothetical protein CVT49_06245 [candidate division Zixibacteria bacterium HGW-Zixibacteria-1]|nr:MAG: hypothetical protein CVT49_06245 [candidate division Zixibacteria bacterium HGW-Zixibacteria-1]